jgi:phenylpropionate dioxygenase-like ring-hydroxylating dioxygenase large terminal subunit
MADGRGVAEAWDAASIRALFDPATGRLDRRVLSDEGLYRLELERIFARGWNFMAHESQLKEAGEYLVTYIGEDQVIVVRDEEGKVYALLNTCRHRGNALCRAEQGRAKSFVCSYHGWNYALDGRLIGVPGQKSFYHDDLDRSRLGLARVRIESYLGFYFATLAEDAPSLADYLGPTGRTGIGMMLANGEIEVAEGVQKNVIDCNWKIAVDNLFDWYHVPFSHASANSAGFLDVARIQFPKTQMVMLGEYGHAIGGPGIPEEAQAGIDAMSDEERAIASGRASDGAPRIRPSAATALMGEAGVRSQGHPNIFPNLWVTISGAQMCLRLPRGPSRTELWWFTLVPKAAPPPMKREFIRRMSHIFGPAGLLEQDDGENWSQSTRSARGLASRQLGQHLSMGIGHDEVRTNASGEHFIEGLISEHGQRWLYRAWTEWMSARDWSELEANHSRPRAGAI